MGRRLSEGPVNPLSQNRDMGHPECGDLGLEGVAVAAELDGGCEEDGCESQACPEAGGLEEVGGRVGHVSMTMPLPEEMPSEPMGPWMRYLRNSNTWPVWRVIISRTPRAKGGSTAQSSGVRRAQAETRRNQHQMGAYQRGVDGDQVGSSTITAFWVRGRPLVG